MGHVSKGAVTSARLQEHADRMQLLNASWWYSWGDEPRLGYPVNDFTPMIWGRRSATPENIRRIDRDTYRTGATRLLGFNEPDLAGQAEMTVDEALELWKILENSKLKLVSPACIRPNAPWMIEFMERALKEGRRVDEVALHIYQSPDPDAFIRKVKRAFNAWQRPIWITETAVADWDAKTSGNDHTRAEVNAYLKEIWARANELPYVKRFCWKTRVASDPVMGTSALFKDDHTLTSTGRIYAGLK